MDEQNRELAAASEASATKSSRLRNLMVMIAVLAIAVGCFIFWMVRQINVGLQLLAGRMARSAEKVATAAGQVSGSSRSLAQGASEQAASLEETSASTEEIASITRKNADHALQVAGLMQQSEQGAVEVNQTLDRMVEKMKEIDGSSNKIARIIKVIDEIAFQTNILALNAAVEAARAGEAGLGFAVVADEVRNLAQRCAQAARDTALLIEDSIANSRDGNAQTGSDGGRRARDDRKLGAGEGSGGRGQPGKPGAGSRNGPDLARSFTDGKSHAEDCRGSGRKRRCRRPTGRTRGRASRARARDARDGRRRIGGRRGPPPTQLTSWSRPLRNRP